MFNILALYIFLSSILLAFIIKYLIEFTIHKSNINIGKYIYSIILGTTLGFLLIKFIPSSFVYNNDIFSNLLYALLILIGYIYIGDLEKKYIPKENSKYSISELLLLLIIMFIYIIYIITLIFFDMSFYANINILSLITITLGNTLLLLLYFIFNNNSIKIHLLGLGIIIILGGIMTYILTSSGINNAFLPGIATNLQSLFGFITLFYIFYILIQKKYINNIFILILLGTLILGKTIL